MSAAFCHRWGLQAEPDSMCSGRPFVGWFGTTQ